MRVNTFRDLSLDREYRIQARHGILKNHSNPPAADSTQRLSLERQHIGLAHTDAASSFNSARLGNELKKRETREALAGSRLSNQRQCLAPLQREAHPIHRAEPGMVCARKADAKIFDVEDCGHALLGSTASRRASPNRLADKTVMTMASPGKMPVQGALTITSLESRIIPPHDGVGG